jgi:choline dehydrogenase-like flavoprotein
MTGRIQTAADLTEDVTLETDVVIVGSGAGGAVLAAGLVAQGLRVVMLEEGDHATRADFRGSEAESFPKLYQERGTRSTADQAITILQGRSVGGSTTVNWTTCFRTPSRILAHWRDVHGLPFTDEALAPHFEAVEARLSIAEWPEAMANANNHALLAGARKLGWEVRPLRRNVKGCANTGLCGVGCPVDGKQAMGITYITDAVAAGMTLLANVRVDRILHDGTRATGVQGRVFRSAAADAEGPAVHVNAKVVVSAAGAINGPGLLLRSGITAGGRVGRRTFLHPVIGLFGRMPTPVAPWSGAPQSIGSHQHVDRGADKVGFFLEAAPLQPMLAAVAFNAFGRQQHALIAQLEYANAIIALSVDGLVAGDDGGTVRLRDDGRPVVDYPIRPALREAFAAAHRAVAEVQLAAGAETVASLHVEAVVVQREDELDLFANAPYGAHEHAIFSAHQMGGCAMASSPERGVVDTEHRVFGFENLFVVDGSVLPTALGVNPSETIYGLAHRAVPFVAAAATGA